MSALGQRTRGASRSALTSAGEAQPHAADVDGAVDFWNWSELELERSRAAKFHSELVLVMTTKDELSLELLDLSSVQFSWTGGKAEGWCKCQVFLASPTKRCVWYQVPGHSL